MCEHVKSENHQKSISKENKEVVLTASFTPEVVKVDAADSVFRPLHYAQTYQVKEQSELQDHECNSYDPEFIPHSIELKAVRFQSLSVICANVKYDTREHQLQQ